MNQLIGYELDREHAAPVILSRVVTAPYELDSHASVEWVLETYGEASAYVECLGRWDEDGNPTMGYSFRVAPKV